MLVSARALSRRSFAGAALDAEPSHHRGPPARGREVFPLSRWTWRRTTSRSSLTKSRRCSAAARQSSRFSISATTFSRSFTGDFYGTSGRRSVDGWPDQRGEGRRRRAKSYSEGIVLGLNQLNSPEIMQVHHAFDARLPVHHHQRSNLALLKHRKSLRSQLVHCDSLRSGIHRLSGGP